MRDHGANAGKAVVPNVEMFLVCMDLLERQPAFPASYAKYTHDFRAAMLRDVGWSLLRVNGDVNTAREYYRRAVRLRTRELLHPRTLAGMALSIVPVEGRSYLNRLANRVKRVKGNAVYVDDANYK